MEEVERLTKKVGTDNKSDMAERLLSIALDDMIIFEKAGLLDLVLAGRNIVGKFKEMIIKGQIKTDDKGELQIVR
jgi:hypothetical protein